MSIGLPVGHDWLRRGSHLIVATATGNPSAAESRAIASHYTNPGTIIEPGA
jgi:hypothetical protein